MSWSNIRPIVTVKSLDSSLNTNIQVEFDSHADTSVVGSNVLVLHDHEQYVDVFGYIVNLGIKMLLLWMLL